MKHIVLLGDSIFDNGVYVPGEPAVIDQLRAEMPDDCIATLRAIDGHLIRDIASQCSDLPIDATDCVVSVGGNDALGHAHFVEQVDSIQELGLLLTEVVSGFQQAYAEMLDEVMALNLNTTLCTIYDKCPFLDAKWRDFVPVALDTFNNVILEEAGRRDIAVIELREVCTDVEDYSNLSPIEPSSRGGMKIVHAIIEQLCRRDA